MKYLAAGANRYTDVADWHRDGHVAFGADDNVCLWQPTVREMKHSPRGPFQPC